MTAVLLVTPLFALIDFGFGSNLRVPILDEEPGLRATYYGAVTLLGLLAVWVPVVAGPIGILDAGLNVTLTVLAVFIPYVQMIQASGEGRALDPDPFPLTAFMVNAVIVGLAMSSLRQRRPRGRKT
jgi:hypothetical protein